MIKKLFFVFFSVSLVAVSFSQTTLFDADWRFHRGGALRAEVPEYDDAKWRAVDLPHDWSIEDLPGTQSPFNPDAIGQVGTGFTTGGTGWYRKSFTIPAEQKNKRIYIEFEGVYMNADFWVNGVSLGNHPYGYTSFSFDVTNQVKFGEKNIIAVQVKNEGQNSRWYSGSGIYRHVWLKVVDPVHIAQWGTYITTPVVNASSAKVNIKTKIENATADKEVTLMTRILDAKGVEVAKTQSKHAIKASANIECNDDVNIFSPLLWSIETPTLYTAVSEVYQDGKLTDKTESNFGIRTISFDAVNGFMLNGKSTKLKGGCIHNDNGPLGSKAYDRAEERKIEILKASGFNAIRCAHNPPSPALLNACDRLGMLVIDEAFDMWRLGNNPNDYHLFFDEWWQRDIESLVLRDKNHPAIIMWSIGNEIRDMETPPVIAVAKMLGAQVRKLDPTRPVTAAVNGLRPQKDPFFSTLDVGGYNYAAGGDHHQESIYEQDHKRVPNRVMWGSESYAMETFDTWMGVVDHPWVIGDFVWTAFDYIGEASIGWRGYWQESNFYPWNLAFCGDVDICGWRRPQSFYREVLWNPNKIAVFVKPPVPSFPVNPNKQEWSKWEWHDVVPEWNWKGYENKPFEVTVYSSCEQVELVLNNKSLGRKATSKETKFMASWHVPYQKGELKAIGYNANKVVNVSSLHTADEPVKIRLSPDKKLLHADNQDLSYITVELVDSKGNVNPTIEKSIAFTIVGDGKIVGVHNANPTSRESFQQPKRQTWKGRCMVVIKAGKTAGDIILNAKSNGLSAGKVIISATK